jgi:toxin FitB
VSMLAPTKAAASQSFVDWLQSQDAAGQLYLTVVTIHEIEKGIALLEHKGAVAKASALKVWLSGLISNYDDKILVIDAAAAAMAGQLEAQAIATGHNPGMTDAAIAGIAKVHDLVILTTNTRHFLPFGVKITSPDEAA